MCWSLLTSPTKPVFTQWRLLYIFALLTSFVHLLCSCTGAYCLAIEGDAKITTTSPSPLAFFVNSQSLHFKNLTEATKTSPESPEIPTPCLSVCPQVSCWWPSTPTSSCQSTSRMSSTPTAARTWGTWTPTSSPWPRKPTSRWPGQGEIPSHRGLGQKWAKMPSNAPDTQWKQSGERQCAGGQVFLINSA